MPRTTKPSATLETALAAETPAMGDPIMGDPITGDPVRERLRDVFGFSTFRPGQEGVVRSLLDGRSALAVFPTGGGKSLCYQLPALLLDGVTVVISPLIALMKDQIDVLRSRGVAAARLDSTIDRDELYAIDTGLADGSLKLLYVAPERFHNERFLAQMERTKIAMLAIDEAHCISEWGHNFRPDYLMLGKIVERIGAERVLALTATATPKVVADIEAAFGIVPSDTIVTGFYRSNLRLLATPVAATERDVALVRSLKEAPPGASIVYVTLQKTAERVAEFLRGAGFDADAYHAGLDSEIRDRVQEKWMRSARGVVVATIAFGMGIDKSDVRSVIHYNLPKSLESYTQEIGRAGRDGRESYLQLLACPDDIPTLENFAFGDTPDESSIASLIDWLLSQGREFDLSLYELSSRFDIRQLVLKTILTYLELAGVLHQGTPFYAGYEIKLSDGQTPASIASSFGVYGSFVSDVFSAARFGRTWYALNPDTVASQLGVERRRIVRMLDVLVERGLAEIRVSEIRQRYSRLNEADDSGALVETLSARFVARETSEQKRIRQVVTLATLDGCRTNALAGYFGEKRPAPCGHCFWCETRTTLPMPPRTPVAAIDESVWDQAGTLRRAHPDALGTPRQLARFLCGISSPGTSRARLGRHALFGALESHSFADVLALCDA